VKQHVTRSNLQRLAYLSPLDNIEIKVRRDERAGDVIALRPKPLRQHSKAYSEEFERYTDGTCCDWDSYDIAPKKTQGNSV